MGNILTKMATRSMTNMAKTAATTAAVTAGTSLMTKALGVDDTLFGKVVQAGVPAMVLAGSKDRSITGNLLGNSKKKDRRRRATAEDAERDFFDVFGPKAPEITKAVAEETGATEKQVGGILGMMLPDFEQVIAEEAPADEEGLMSIFGREAQEEQTRNPGFARMAAKSLF